MRRQKVPPLARRLPFGLLAALMSELLEDFANRSGFEVDIALDC